MTTRTFALLFAVALAACSSSDANNGICPPCPAGYSCSAATGYRCVSNAAGCPASGCGANATCRADGVCTCAPGFVDCDQDLGQTTGNGCECQGGCSGASCAASAMCNPATPNACGHNTVYCADGECSPCAAGSFNCDGISTCERNAPCNVTSTCSPTQALACGTAQYCNGTVCATCPEGLHNCDGVGDCESAAACAGQPPGTDTCDPTCTDAWVVQCVRNPARGNYCEECLDDTHCLNNPRSHGLHCNTDDLAGTGANWCVCADHSECATSTLGKKCNPVPTAVPKPAFKQCTCETDADCNAPYTICEGGSSGFGRCKMRCVADDPATPLNEEQESCYWAGMVGRCDVATGKCDYSDH